MENKKKIAHIDDDLEILDRVKYILSPMEDYIELGQFTNQHDFVRSTYVSSDLYLFDRHFPAKEGEHPNDESWRELTRFIGKMVPESRGIVILSNHPPADRDWRCYRNIVDTIRKPEIWTNYIEVFDRIKSHLGVK